MNVKNIARIILGIAAILLAYYLFESIMKPQRFETLKAKKEAEVITRLKDIRTAELAYRGVYGQFCGSLDSLIVFLQNGQLPTVKKTGEIPDSLTEEAALKLGLIRRDTIYDDAYSVLFPNITNKEEHLANLKYIPFTNNTKEFTVKIGIINRSNVDVPVVEVGAHLSDYLTEAGYEQLIRNAIKRQEDMNRFPGRKFGSMEDPQTEGNWE
jgi:hypothetical protein